jgi:hypothetical protein
MKTISWMAVIANLLWIGQAYADGLPGNSWWPVWRHDGRRSGHSDLKGDITKPVLSWRYFLGGPLTSVVDDRTDLILDTYDLDGRGGVYRVHATTKSILVQDAKTGTTVWQSKLKPHAVPYIIKVADFNPKRLGLELAVWPPQGNYTGDFGDRAYCFGFENGVREGRLLWKASPPTGHLYSPRIMIADVDNDDVNEIVIMDMQRATVWDGVTGHLDYNIAWKVNRTYGYATCVNIDEDPFLEIVVVADYVPHVDVLDVTDASGGARLLWQHEYRPGMESNPKPNDMFLRARPNSVVDLNGDGTLEIIVNLYNQRGDRRWHLTVYDVRSGQTLVDQPDQFVWGIEDTTGDGHPELLCVGTHTVNPHSLGELTIFQLRDSTLKSLWKMNNARFLLKNRRISPNTASGAVEGQLTSLLADVNRDGSQEVLIERDTDGDRQVDRFEAYGLDQRSHFAPIWSYQAAKGKMVNARSFSDVKAGSGGELQFSYPATGDIITVDAKGQTVSTTTGVAVAGYATVPVAADVDGDGLCEIAVANSHHEVELLRAPQSGGGTVTQLWKKKSHGMAWYPGYSRPKSMLAMADLNHDGTVETIFCGETADGTATIAVAEPDGSIFWKRAFRGVGTDGIYSVVSHWFIGNFVGDETRDVGVVYNQIGNGSSEMAIIDGSSGRLAWDHLMTRQVPGESRSLFVSTRPIHNVHDFNGDGKDDIAYIDVYTSVILSGIDGRVLQAKGVVDIFGRTLNYPYTMLADVDHDGKTDLLHHGPLMHTMAQTSDMKKHWFVDFKQQANHFPPAIADVDGDSIPELGMPGEDGIFRCLRANDGSILWQEKIGHPGASTVGAADVDGDGGQDFFYLSKERKLVVVRGMVADGQNRVLWTLPVGTGLHPIFCDVDGDGSGEFLLSTYDGFLKCIDQRNSKNE